MHRQFLFPKKNSKYEIKIFKNTQKSVNAGLLKIMSKMGICTIASYRNSGLFDVVGLSDEIVNDCFTGAHSELAGLTYADIEQN